MAIPDLQSIMLPLLKLAGDGEVHSIHEVVEDLADHFSLEEGERTKLLPSGQQPVFYNRVGWARTYLKKAGLLEDPRRGHFRITARGKEVLAQNPPEVDMRFLRQFPEYVEFRETTGKNGTPLTPLRAHPTARVGCPRYRAGQKRGIIEMTALRGGRNEVARPHCR